MSVASSWKNRAADLAAWAWERLVNRTDVWGGYSETDDPKRKTHTRPAVKDRGKKALTHEVLVQHFGATTTRHVIGLHTTSPENLSKWGGVDVDYHGDGSNAPADNERAAMRWYGELRRLTFRPLLIDSNGNGGYHLLPLLKGPAPTAEVFVFTRWLTGDYADFGFQARPECFPKQKAVASPGQKGEYGNWLRVPGKHHKRDHWSRTWDGARWLEGDQAIEYILSLAGDDPELILSPPIEAYAAKLPNLGEGMGRDDVAYTFACFLALDMRLSDATALRWLGSWDSRNTPPKGNDRLAEILRNARQYGRGFSTNGRHTPGVNGTHSSHQRENPKPGASGVAPEPAAAPEPPTAAVIIADYFREKYRPDFRRGNAVHTATGEIIPMGVACEVPTSKLITRLEDATNAPRFANGPVKTDALPGLFKKWVKVAWGDLLESLPEEDDAKLDRGSHAAEEFRRMVRHALLSEMTLGDTIGGPARVVQVERRSVIEWCEKFAKSGPWRSLRSRRIWCKTVIGDGGEITLRVALRVELFAQTKADRRLCEMNQNTFTRRAAQYGVGTSERNDRPHGLAAVVLADDFVRELTAGLDNDREAEQAEAEGIGEFGGG